MIREINMKAASSSLERVKWYDQLDELYPAQGRHRQDTTYTQLASRFLTDLFNRTIADVIVFVWNPDCSDFAWALKDSKTRRKLATGHVSLAWKSADKRLYYASLWAGKPNADGHKLSRFQEFIGDLEFFERLPDQVCVVAWQGMPRRYSDRKQVNGSSIDWTGVEETFTRAFKEHVQHPHPFVVRPREPLADNCTTFIFRLLEALGLWANSTTMNPGLIRGHLQSPLPTSARVALVLVDWFGKVPLRGWTLRRPATYTPNYLMERIQREMNSVVCSATEIADLWSADSTIRRSDAIETVIATLTIEEADGAGESGEIDGE